jgi:hypothetical protein
LGLGYWYFKKHFINGVARDDYEKDDYEKVKVFVEMCENIRQRQLLGLRWRLTPHFDTRRGKAPTKVVKNLWLDFVERQKQRHESLGNLLISARLSFESAICRIVCVVTQLALLILPTSIATSAYSNFHGCRNLFTSRYLFCVFLSSHSVGIRLFPTNSC